MIGGSSLFTKTFTMELKVKNGKGKNFGEQRLDDTDYKRTDILRLEVDPSNIKQCLEIKEYIIKNDWVQSLVENFVEILPEIISKCENLKRLDQNISFEVISKLLSEAVKWTINLWEVFHQSCRSYSEN